ncbi:MAG TPA: glycosyltransferase [Anaeromyxobacteraceae bacterium]|nr:glycosyltransferase [Anaeromyxobacteraceae bacterium]
MSEPATQGGAVPGAGSPRYTSVTMVLPTYDEAARVRRVIEYYRPFAPILVVDNESSDGTPEIVRALGLRTVRFANGGTIQTPEWFRHVAALIDTDYFVLLSCSEFLPASLLERFDEIARSRSADVVSCVRRIYTCGELMPEIWGREPRIERLFNRAGLDFQRISIHGSFRSLDPSRELHLPSEDRYTASHLRDSDAASLMKKHTDYGAVEARHRIEQGNPPGFRWLLSAVWGEIRRYRRVRLLRRGRLALREVWARIVMHSIVYWIGWELRQGRTIEYSRRRSDEIWQQLARSERG